MNVAFIPVRGGSKSIPLKNIKNMCGKPLVYWTVAAACRCAFIDKVYVATDSERIKEAVSLIRETEKEALFQKIEVVGRSAESASDAASTESAMLEFAEQYEFEHIVLIQATSPLLSEEDLDRGFALYQNDDTDSVLSVVRQKRFYWSIDEDGNAKALNYDCYHRPRRQDFAGCFVENGAFYITSKLRLLDTKNRISGRIKACEMGEDAFFEIDEPGDWEMIENLLSRRLRERKRRNEESRPIKMFLTDCDGCLTDGGMYYSEQGDELKKFSTLDGLGFRLLREKGIICGIVTGENTKLVQRRAEKLKLDVLEMGVMDKLAVVEALCEKYRISLEEVAYVGDDINDSEVLKAVGFSASVPDAIASVAENVDYVTKRQGGSGAVREVIDYLLSQENI